MQDLTNRAEQRTAGEASQPKGAGFDASWMALRAHRMCLRDAVTAAAGLALGTIRLPHPRLDMYQWLTFLGAHEARHVAQVEENAAVFNT